MANTGQCHLRVANTLLDIIEYVTILTINIKSGPRLVLYFARSRLACYAEKNWY